jgi:response regulator RpfG family c-di-GMP phosphodiesterase
MNVNVAARGLRPPLVLVVDPSALSRHWMWRTLSNAFGVIEASNARAAGEWIARRPDIDALIVDNELPDQRGVDFVGDLASHHHPVTSRAIVLARSSDDWEGAAPAGATLIERGDLRSVLSKLAGWFLARDAGLTRALLREAERPRA